MRSNVGAGLPAMATSALTQHSALAFRAKHTRPLPQHHIAQFAAADLARLAAPAVDEQFLLKIPRLPVTADKVPQCGAATLDGGGQHTLDLNRQLQVTPARNATGSPARVNPGGKQRFGR